MRSEGALIQRTRISIRVKMFALISSLLVGLCAFFVLYFPARQIASLEQALEQKAESLSRLIAFQVRSSIAFNDKETARETFEGALLDRDVAFLALYDEQGVALQAMGAGSANTLPFEERGEVIRGGERIRVRVPVVSLEGPRGTLVVELSTKSILAQAAAVRKTAAYVGLLAVTLGMLLAWLVGSSFGSRLRRIAGSAATIASGDLSTACVTDGSSDEIAQLGHSFNDMRRKLQELLAHIAEAAAEIDTAAQGFMSLAATQKQGAERQSGAVDQGQETVQLLGQCAEKLAQAATGMAEAADKGQTVRESERRALAERIEHLSNEAVSATEESAFIMRAVSDVAEQTVETCAQVVGGAGKLVSLSQGLQAVVGKFVLTTAVSAPSERRVPAAAPSIAPAE